ncbi:glycosyltransferase 87 family protein [Actinacidiphila glaucinigra]|uniref:glycosyltransferase 87 family protein n=1 Tax=Actinacidiphila glaucinigra TaxID=235986 RepID=UPI000B76E78C|nr:glycosyltransferase 87 family protein [Actinacidiphila glaucinigra]
MTHSTEAHGRERPALWRTPPTVPGRPRADRRLLLAGLLLVVSLAAFTALCLSMAVPMADMQVYRAEGAAAVDGTDLYGFTVTEWNLPATYPPFAALLFVPTTWLPVPLLKLAFMGGNLLLLGLLAHLSCRATGWPRARGSRWVVVLLAMALGLWLEPVFQTMLYGQINLLLAVLVLWDLSRPDGARGKGIAIGVAAGIKLTPAIFAVYLLLTGRRKEAAVAAAGFAGTALLGALALPGATVDYWTRCVFDTSRIGKVWIVDNQSLQGFAARVLHTAHPGAVWAVAALVVACAGLAVSVRMGRLGREAWGVVCCAVTALLITPISWSHHWVWCVPMLILLAAEAPRWALRVAAVVFLARTLWIVPKAGDLDLHLAWWLQPFASPYPVLGLFFLAAVALRFRPGSPTMATLTAKGRPTRITRVGRPQRSEPAVSPRD